MIGGSDIESPEDDVLHLATLLRRWGWVLAAATLVGAALGGWMGDMSGTTYESKIDVLVGPVVPDADFLEGTADLARTYGEIVESRRVIAEAIDVAGIDVNRSQVEVSAQAGRDSATLTIRVRTPSQSATPLLAAALVDSLREVVTEAQARGPVDSTVGPVGPPTLADELATPALPIGSLLIVIDDGAGRARDASLGTVEAAGIGALGALMLAAAVALAAEVRRTLDPLGGILEARVGEYLGRVDLSSVFDPFALLPGVRIPTDPEAVHDAELIIHNVLRETRVGDDRVVLFITAPTADAPYIGALLQLLSAFPEPPLILDPEHIVAGAIDSSAELEPLRAFLVTVGGWNACHLVVPEAKAVRRVVSAQHAANALRLVADKHTDTVVFVPTNHRFPSWQHWAVTADRTVVLARSTDLRDAVMGPTVERLAAVGAAPVGGVLVRRRFAVRSRTKRAVISGRSRPTGLGLVDNPDQEGLVASR